MTKSDENADQSPTGYVLRPGDEIEQSPQRGRGLFTVGRSMLVLGALAQLGSVLFLAGSYSAGRAVEPLLWIRVTVAMVVGISLVAIGRWAVLRGTRHLHPVLSNLRAESDGDRFVLFLRAFSDDSGFAWTASRLHRWLAWPPLVAADVRTEEEQLARGLAPFGRMVALGYTEDRLPRSGAERHYANEREWQAEVLDALEHANLVLFSAGAGRSLEWEVQQAVQRDEPTRLVILITRDSGQYRNFRHSLRSLFPKGLPDEPQSRGPLTRYVRAVVWFEQDWTPHLQMLKGVLPLFRPVVRTQYALPRALRPVYERAKLRVLSKDSSPVSRPRTVLSSVALFSVSMPVTPPGLFLLFILVEGPPGSGVVSTGNAAADLLMAVTGFVFFFSMPFVAWMRRVLRGGPVAIFAMQISCLPLGMCFLSAALTVSILSMVHFADGSEVIGTLMLLFSLHLIVLAVAVPLVIVLFLRRGKISEWVESRT